MATVWCVWSDNGAFEAPSLVAICATPELAEAERDKDPFGSAWTVDEWETIGDPAPSLSTPPRGAPC